MKGLIQRVSSAQVVVDGEIIGKIDRGILLLLGVEKDDDTARADKLIDKVTTYRIFSDADGKMNLSLRDIEGELLVVSQFTLVADTAKGKRPGFSRGAPPALGEELYNYFCDAAKASGIKVATGQFGADMKVSLTNDGPVTFWLES